MSKLHHIIGTIMRDIAKSRVYSDVYSYEVSSHYETDPLLRQFPVPRTEITQLELELKFAFAGTPKSVDKQDLNEDWDEQVGIFRTQTTFLGRYLIQDSVANTEVHLELNNDEKYPEKDRNNWENLKKALSWKQHENRIHQIIIEYFEKELEKNRKEGKKRFDLKVEVAEKEILSQVESYLYSVDKVAQFIDKVSKVRETISMMVLSKLHRDLLKIEEEVEFMMNMMGANSPEVEIKAETLGALSTDAISTIKVTTGVRNYVWTKVSDSEDGRPVRRLMPE